MHEMKRLKPGHNVKIDGRPSARGRGDRRRRLAFTAAALAVLVLPSGCIGPAINDLFGARYPRYVYTETRTEVVFDGQRVVIEGQTRCQRNINYRASGERVFFSLGGPLYQHCRPRWFGTWLPGGGALLVGPFGGYREIGKSLPDLSDPDYGPLQAELDQRPRTVLWLNDARTPSRAEYYFATSAMADPRSRLTAIETRILSISGSVNPRESYSKTGQRIPWLAGEGGPRSLMSHYTIAIPKKRWGQAEGLEAALAHHREPVLLTLREDLTRNQVGDVFSRGKARSVNLSAVQSRRDAGDLYSDQLDRMQLYLRDESGVLRPIAGYPKGVLVFQSGDDLTAEDRFRIPLADRDFEAKRDRTWYTMSAKILFDPATQTFYALRGTRIYRPTAGGEFCCL